MISPYAIDPDSLAWPFGPLGTRPQDFQALSRLINCRSAGQGNLSRYRLTEQMDFGVKDAVPLAQFSNRPRLRVQRFRMLTLGYIHNTLTQPGKQHRHRTRQICFNKSLAAFV